METALPVNSCWCGAEDLQTPTPCPTPLSRYTRGSDFRKLSYAQIRSGAGHCYAVALRLAALERDRPRDRTEARLAAMAARVCPDNLALAGERAHPALVEDDRRQCTDSILVEAAYRTAKGKHGGILVRFEEKTTRPQ